MIRVIIADDHSIVRQGLKNILSLTEDMEVVAEAGDGNELLTIMENTECDVVVLDISMPGIDVLNIISSIKTIHPETGILILSMHPENLYAFRMLKAGASGYMTKETAPDELVTAIRKVACGQKYISQQLASMLPDLMDSSSLSPHEQLSSREHQVFCMIGSGFSAKEIAQKLCLSVKTIYTYRARILEKMKMKNTAELILYAVQKGLTYTPTRMPEDLNSNYNQK